MITKRIHPRSSSRRGTAKRTDRHPAPKSWIARVTVAAACLISSLPVRADYLLGLRAYERSDFARARSEFFQSALDEHADAQFYLGEIHEGGVGVSIDQEMGKRVRTALVS